MYLECPELGGNAAVERLSELADGNQIVDGPGAQRGKHLTKRRRRQLR